MNALNITVEVHCLRPSWAEKNPKNKFSDSKYRIFINNNLITERSWNWNNNIFLIENMWINLNYEFEYVLKVEPIVFIQEQAKFFLENFQSKTFTATSTKINDQQINFCVR